MICIFNVLYKINQSSNFNKNKTYFNLRVTIELQRRSIMKSILSISIENLKDELIAIRRHLHKNPELGFDIINTKTFVEAKLKEYGYEVQDIGVNGLSATVGNGNGKCILLRADMDALPIFETNDLDFKSQIDGKMHACGHDIHTTMLLGAAKIFKKFENVIQGTIKLMFQPAEETLQGALNMIENGILSNPKPDVASMIHVASGMPISVGTVALFNGGPIMAASDTIEIKLKGKGGHGSSPYLAIDPLIPAATLISSLQSIQTREMVPNSLNSMTFGLVNGAATANVISDEITIGGTLRTYNNDERIYIQKRISEMSEHMARAFRCDVEVSFPSHAPVFINDGTLAHTFKESLQDIIPNELLVGPMDLQTPVMGSEDFAYISQEIPAILLYLGAGDSRNGEIHGVHSPYVVFNEECITNGVKAHVFGAMNWLEKNKG